MQHMNKNRENTEIVLDFIAQENIVHGILERICSELESAAYTSDLYEISGLSNEFRYLLEPLKNELSSYEPKC